MDLNLKGKFSETKSFEDFRREISIIELAVANGYTHEVKKGRRTPVFYHPEYRDRIIVINPGNAANQGYWNPADDTDKGTLINFVKKRLGTLFPQDNALSEHGNVNSVLYHYLRLPVPVRSQNQQPCQALENVAPSEFMVRHYQLQPLTQTGFLCSRYIAPATLRLPEFAGRIFNVQHATDTRFVNTAFPYFLAGEEKIVGLEIRNHDFKSHAAGSDRSHGVWRSNMPPILRQMVLVESALDALAYHELKKPADTLYVSYGGNLTLNQVHTIRQIKERASLAENFRFVAASDNDLPGSCYDLMLIRQLAAGSFPSQFLASDKSCIKLAFTSCTPAGSPQAAGPVLGYLADRIRENMAFYNDKIDQELKKHPLSRLVCQEVEKGKIKLEEEGDRLIIQIPNNFFALHAFNQVLIQAANLSQQICLDKALRKDYNEDLKLLKQINQHAPLLAQLNKEVFLKDIKAPLCYQELQHAWLQAGYGEQIKKLFLIEDTKAENPILRPGNRENRPVRLFP